MRRQIQRHLVALQRRKAAEDTRKRREWRYIVRRIENPTDGLPSELAHAADSDPALRHPRPASSWRKTA